jgi:hypothetical protein
MSKPVWVYVHWSENKAFKNKDLLPFMEFETKCRQVAREVGLDNGYDKTKIKVLFNDGEYYETRLDLCPKEDTGFQSYCESMITWIGSERFLKTYDHDKVIIEEYENLKAYLLKIEWP